MGLRRFGWMFFLVACGSPAPVTTAPRASAVAPPPVAAGPRRPPVDEGAARLVLPKVDPSRWAQPTSSLASASMKLVAVGEAVAIVEMASHPYLVSSSQGMLGALQPPRSATWLGVGAGDNLFAASPGGYLHRAESGRADAGFAAAAHLPAAVTWDAAGAWLVAGGGEQVWRSNDGGKTFTENTVAPGFDVRRVLTRPDGLVLVSGFNRQGGRALRMYKDGVWRRSAHAITELERSGSWITGRSVGGCPATLADDGHTWVGDGGGGFEPSSSPIETSAWTALAGTSHTQRFVSAPGWNASRPAAPSPVGRPGPNDCSSDASGGGFGLVGMGEGGRLCVGVGCMRRMGPQRKTAVDVSFFPRSCGAEAPSSCQQSPAAIAVDHRRARGRLRVPLPSGCVPQSIHDVGGAGWLVCRDGRSHIIAADGRVYAEDRLPWRPSDVGALVSSVDGTTLVRCKEGGACAGKLWVRDRRGLGTSGAWREIDVKTAVAFAPLTEGRVVVVTTPGDPAVLQRPPGAALWPRGGLGRGSGRDPFDVAPRAPASLSERARREAERKSREAEQARREKERAAWNKRREAERGKLETASLVVHHPDGRQEFLGRDLHVGFVARRLEVTAAGPVLVGELNGKAIFRRVEGGKLIEAAEPPQPARFVSRPSWGYLTPHQVTADETHLYWIEKQRVMRMAKVGGEPEAFLSELPRASALAHDKTHLYVGLVGDGKRDGEVLRVHKDDGTRQTGFSGLVRPVVLRVVGGALYVGDDGDPNADDGVVHVRSAAGDVRVLAQGLGRIRDLVVDSGAVVIAAGRTVLSVPSKDSGRVTLVGAARRPQAIATVHGQVFWADPEADRLLTSSGAQSCPFARVRSMVRRGDDLLIANGDGLGIWGQQRWREIRAADASTLVSAGDDVFLFASGWDRVTAIYRVEPGHAGLAAVYHAPTGD